MERNRTPYGLDLIQTCLSCPVREERLFCDLSRQALSELNAIRQTSVYPKGAILFVEGQPSRGIFLLCTGSAKLTATSGRGGAVIVRVADTGEVLGLSAVMSDAAYEVSAETLEPSEVSFLPREDFHRFLQRNGEVSLRVARHLSMELRRAYHQVIRIALGPNARAKLAGLLLDWASYHARPAARGGVCFHLRLTHEEIGELIGSSRETVTRLLNGLRRQGLIQTQGTLVTVPDPAKLEAILA